MDTLVSIYICYHFNPVALRMAKTQWSFGRSECNRVKLLKMNINQFKYRSGINDQQQLKVVIL